LKLAWMSTDKRAKGKIPVSVGAARIGKVWISRLRMINARHPLYSQFRSGLEVRQDGAQNPESLIEWGTARLSAGWATPAAGRQRRFGV